MDQGDAPKGMSPAQDPRACLYVRSSGPLCSCAELSSPGGQGLHQRAGGGGYHPGAVEGGSFRRSAPLPRAPAACPHSEGAASVPRIYEQNQLYGRREVVLHQSLSSFISHMPSLEREENHQAICWTRRPALPLGIHTLNQYLI